MIEFDDVRDVVLQAYRPMLVENIFNFGKRQAERDEDARLAAIGPLHGPYRFDARPGPGRWTKKGVWIYAHKGRSECNHDDW